MEESKYNLQKMHKKLKKYLDDDRMWHTMGVMYIAAALAMAHHENVEKAQVAGLLHDCAKCIPTKKKLKLCKENHIPVSAFEKEHPFLLHAKVGAYIAREKYGVKDINILQAITWHTTGRENMTKLEKIIYISDYIEPARNKAPGLEEVRRLAFEDLDQCMYQILHNTLDYLSEQPDDIDQATVRAFQFYKEKLSEKE